MSDAPARCRACGVFLVGTDTWRTMTPEARQGRALHRGHGLCAKHYARARRLGDPLAPRPAWTPRPVRGPHLDAEEVLEEWVVLRRSGESVASAAERMGLPFSTLDKALWRARRRGDARGALPQMQRAS